MPPDLSPPIAPGHLRPKPLSRDAADRGYDTLENKVRKYRGPTPGAAQRVRGKGKCRRCEQPGHNMRTCPNE